MSDNKHTDRTGLYLMVAAILFFGPCGHEKKADEILYRVKRIEQQIGVEQPYELTIFDYYNNLKKKLQDFRAK